MKILVVSATEKEILPAKKHFSKPGMNACIMKYTVVKSLDVDFLVTGIGGVATTYALSKALSELKYDWVINAGIAGSFTKDLAIGETVLVKDDQFADIGVEDEDSYYTMFEKGFGDANKYPFKEGKLENEHNIKYDLKNVTAITVNTTHGNPQSIKLFKNKFAAEIETMEGAAFAYVCKLEGARFLQLRTISNYVEERAKADWNIPLAIENLNSHLIKVINSIS